MYLIFQKAATVLDITVRKEKENKVLERYANECKEERMYVW